jgi:hypothetical protein
VKFDVPVGVELWADIPGFFLRCQESKIGMKVNGQEVEITVVITQSCFNQPVKISPY